MKRIAILGSTGSIGTSTLSLLEQLDGFRVIGLAAQRNVARLADQIVRFSPRLVSVATDEAAAELRAELQRRGVRTPPDIRYGPEGLLAVATEPDVDIVLVATVGAVGLLPTYRALEQGKRIALANKETLVMAGRLMTEKAAATGAEILPVDSEHNALHQCLQGVNPRDVARLILTASGGPFRTLSAAELSRVTPEQALQHPTWRMGPKITVDSATLMNKGLEVIEAHWLFGVAPEQIDILIHPQSVVHSMIELVDGSILAQLGPTDMRYAIQYALTYPNRRPTPLPRLNFSPALHLEFHPPDLERFPCVRLAYEALRRGGTMPAVLNAANEEAVAAFLERRLPFLAIPTVIERVMRDHQPEEPREIEDVLRADAWARARAREVITSLICAESLES
ncbi:MAG: 1-deoxy-D-xylulose-5-phosphate reductoisomerase [Blastocatellia bacterium]|nr:1-deoxy-D-xylulose-5-phosphate reductoisomerase [Blastocatellia bacterium]MCS7156611.1 1-deoxy-D-xylulose-5-phosphate reductoisomerase [Blastocatellia bacterium]MCX7751647.1 1-deoxy-D-xylulose-5-phosphate reductoisomerase [Blastocatellia bacterium]MDW8168747.1 1-deoxy-D-xylulose-5-phosphate reductoisomerase [Acidobacteriota bacterium]